MQTRYRSEDLQQIREDFGLTQAQLAEELDVELSWVTKREQGVTGMSRSDNTLIRFYLDQKS